MIERLTKPERRKLDEWLADWRLIARDKQLPPPGDWDIWLIRSGRGWGKTATGSAWIKQRVLEGARRIALIAETAADARDVLVEGETGLLNAFAEHQRPDYEPSKRRLTFHTGAIATTFAGEKPDQLRGPQFDTAWVDELAKFQYPDETWDNLEMALRMGEKPRCLVTTTPRPLKLIRRLMEDPTVHVTSGSTFENKTLPESRLRRFRERYEGTRIGRQELYGEVLEDVPGALWTLDSIASGRVSAVPELVRVVVAIDPAATSHEESDETGIVVAGRGSDGHAYILADRSCRLSPDGWARQAVNAYEEFSADRILGEQNNGGEMVEHTVRTVSRQVPFKLVHASRGKAKRAEPVAALYEQGKVHHVGVFEPLEDQLLGFTADDYVGDGSPDRADALVWALTELMVTGTWGFEALYPNEAA